MKRILVITNPAAAHGGVEKVFDKVQRLTTAHGDCCTFEFVLTERPGHATELTREKASAYDLVAVFGGDGTINEVANGLAGGNTPMGVIPNGTGNDFARSAGIPRNHRAAIKLLCKGTPKPIDMGVANGRYFTNSVGIGFEGQANYESAQITRIKGSIVFIVGILKTMLSWKAAPVTLTVDGQTMARPDDLTYMVGISNGWAIGGGMKLNPKARLDSNTLHVIRIADINPLKIVFNFLRLFTGTIEKLKEVSSRAGADIEIISNRPLPVHVDGEMLGMDITRLEVQVLPESLEVVWKPR